MDTTILRYSYPEFDDLDLGNSNTVRAAIKSYIDQQYGGGGDGPQPPGGGPQPPGGGPGAGGPRPPGPQSASQVQAVTQAVLIQSAAAEAHPSHSRGGPSHTTQKAEHGKDSEAPNVLNDWTARISFKKHELSGRFFVLIFLGEVPKDPSQWHTSRSLVGLHYTFVNSAASQCNNCRNQADVVMGSFVHLNKAIAERSGLSSYEPSMVVPYLKDNLNWRIQAVRVFFLCLVADLAILFLILLTPFRRYLRLIGLGLTHRDSRLWRLPSWRLRSAESHSIITKSPMAAREVPATRRNR
jgi:tyrosinase